MDDRRYYHPSRSPHQGYRSHHDRYPHPPIPSEPHPSRRPTALRRGLQPQDPRNRRSSLSDRHYPLDTHRRRFSDPYHAFNVSSGSGYPNYRNTYGHPDFEYRSPFHPPRRHTYPAYSPYRSPPSSQRSSLSYNPRSSFGSHDTYRSVGSYGTNRSFGSYGTNRSFGNHGINRSLESHASNRHLERRMSIDSHGQPRHSSHRHSRSPHRRRSRDGTHSVSRRGQSKSDSRHSLDRRRHRRRKRRSGSRGSVESIELRGSRGSKGSRESRGSIGSRGSHGTRGRHRRSRHRSPSPKERPPAGERTPERSPAGERRRSRGTERRRDRKRRSTLEELMSRLSDSIGSIGSLADPDRVTPQERRRMKRRQKYGRG